MAEQNQDIGGDDWIISIIVIGGLLVFLLWAISKFLYPELTELWRVYKVCQLYLWQLISYPINALGFGPSPAEIGKQIDWMRNPPGGLITPEAKALLNKGWDAIWSKVFAVLTLTYAVKFAYNKRGKNRIKLYDYEGVGKDRMGNAKEPLLRLAAQSNPEIEHYVKNNPADYPVTYRPYQNNKYAQRVSPWDFARLSIPPGLDTIEGNPHKDIGPIFDPDKPRGKRFNLKAADTVFSWQLGHRSDGVNTIKLMSPVEKKVFKHLSKNLFGGTKTVNRIVTKHAYIRTALLEMYFQSTASTADMRWLKYEDRTLFYAFQDANLNVASAECAGVWSHWKVERTNQMPVPIPAVEYAVQWMANLADIPDDELAQYIKEDEAVQSDPDYWETQRKDALEILERQEVTRKKVAPKRAPKKSKGARK